MKRVTGDGATEGNEEGEGGWDGWLYCNEEREVQRKRHGGSSKRWR